MVKHTLEKIEEKRFQRDMEKEAKKATREELEQLYIAEKYEIERRINPIWKTITLVAIIGTFICVMSLFIVTTQYAGTEFDNYKELGQYICEIEEFPGKPLIYPRKNTVDIYCGSEKIQIIRKW